MSELFARPPPAAPSPQEVAERLARLPPSARAVFRALEERGPLTARALCDAAGLPARTVRYGLLRLREEGLVGDRPLLVDCRQCTYFAQGACDGKGPDGLPLRLRAG